jgi:hypothetical protein
VVGGPVVVTGEVVEVAVDLPEHPAASRTARSIGSTQARQHRSGPEAPGDSSAKAPFIGPLLQSAAASSSVHSPSS